MPSSQGHIRWESAIGKFRGSTTNAGEDRKVPGLLGVMRVEYKQGWKDLSSTKEVIAIFLLLNGEGQYISF